MTKGIIIKVQEGQIAPESAQNWKLNSADCFNLVWLQLKWGSKVNIFTFLLHVFGDQIFELLYGFKSVFTIYIYIVNIIIWVICLIK